MSDDDLRRILHRAHDGESAPSVRAILERAPRRRRFGPAVVAVAVVVALTILVVRGTQRAPTGGPPVLAVARVEAWAPLDFLLHTPGVDILRTAPAFDARGLIP